MSTYFKNDTSLNEESSNDQSSFAMKIGIYIQQINDKALYYRKERWIGASIFCLLYFIRIIFVGGYYALTYILGIHILNSLIGFISPLEDPDEIDDGQSFLPQK